MTECSRAVFLSYASQDAKAAQRVCDALRAAAVEVWFDKSELRGGDAWDQSIRRQIKACALFLPVISRTTHDRREGYFRLEWKLAIDRCHLMDANLAFLVPIVIDDTPDDDERVPERFREVQWTRLPGGETPASFVHRIQDLLSGEMAPVQVRARSIGSTARSPSLSPRRRLGLLYGAVGSAVLLALGYLGMERLERPKPGNVSAASVAVLPFANESGDPGQQYFSDGISEDLITALGQFSEMKVIGRTSSFQFRDPKEDSRSIGVKLGVAHLLEGSVRKSGEVVRISAELIETADGSAQWSMHYDRPYKDLFALQDEITRAVAAALKAKLLPSEHVAAQSDRPPSGNLNAYNAYLEGGYFWARGTEADVRKVIEYYTQATVLDPLYATAWSRLSRAWTRLGQDHLSGASAQEAYAHARAAADRALALAPDLAAAHSARSWLLQAADFDWHGGEAEARRALELAPNNVMAKSDMADALGILGDPVRAIELQQEAIKLDPLRPESYMWLANFLVALDRLDEAEHAIRKAIELRPSGETYFGSLASIEVLRGNAQAALLLAQKDPDESTRDFALTLARQIDADRTAADAALGAFTKKYADSNASGIADIYALRRNPDATFQWLYRAETNHESSGIMQVLLDPFLRRYTNDPRFAAFCRKVGLPVPGETPAGKST